ncbi:unnamed protein product [Candidula unifasciata]|uniref:Spindle assembly abnormal protein 6 N-terminal domain-containing protein n=1 Tax=Candidula unifasciata TaxID=100452 RepID=A0A8S3ZYG5_9EUPU|nr:unnamed protein product [Candidula unifasciata]
MKTFQVNMMQFQHTNMETVFSKQVPIIMKAPDREERKVFVHLHILMQSLKRDSTKDLIVKLTDDEDLLFLYTLRLAENDFHSLKMQQGLLVDFTAFPQKFVDLLEMCIRENSKDNPKFVIHFVNGGSTVLSGSDAPAVMNIVEINPFKHLNHLSLKYLPGSDADVKSHLASCLKQMKETNSLIQHKFEHTYKELSSQLQETQERLVTKTEELESLKLEWSSRVAEITAKNKEAMAVEKEKTVQFQSSLQTQFDRDRRELEQAHSKLVKQLETRLEEYELANKELTDRKYKSDSSIRDYKSKLSALEEENARIKTELHTLRKEHSSLEKTCQEKDKSISHLQTRVAVLEQELKDKVELASKTNDLFDLEKDKKKHLEADLESKNKEISKLEAKLKAMGEELKKGNNIIEKFQARVKADSSKIKMCRQITTEQEKTLGEKINELEKLRQELTATKDKLRETEDQNHRLSTNLETATKALEDSKNLLIKNENMMEWLHRQINEQKISQSHLGNFELPSSSSLQPRPAAHNYSTSSHGSLGPQESLRPQTLPRVTSTTLGAQLQQTEQQSGHVPAGSQHPGNPVGFRKSAIPVIQSQTSTSPTSQNTFNNSGGAGRDGNLPLDPKFLMKKEEAIPVRGILNYNSSSMKSSTVPSVTLSSATSLSHPQQNQSAVSAVSSSLDSHRSSVAQPQTTLKPIGNLLDNGGFRLSQQMIVPKPQPPLVSAYFPSNS